MAAPKISNTAASAAADAVTALLNSGTLVIYTGSAPATVDTAATGTVLATLTLDATAFGAASNGVATANSITSATAAATGTAGYFRLLTSGAAARVQGDVTATGGGGDLELNTTSVSSGATVSVTALTYTQPKQ